MVDRLGPARVGGPRRPGAGGQARRRRGGVGWRELRAAADDGRPLARASSGHRGRGARPGPGRRGVPRPDPGRRAAPAGRRGSGRAAPETVAFTRRPVRARRVRGRAASCRRWWRSTPAGSATALLLVPPSRRPPSGPGGSSTWRARRRRSHPARQAVGPDGRGVGRRAGGPSRLAPTTCTRWTALGLALTCADLVGAMRGAVDLATDYATARQQYGVPIGSFQAVQHLLADAFVPWRDRAASPCTRPGPWTSSLPRTPWPPRRWPRPTAPGPPGLVCETAIQVHGGIGNTWECLAHVYLRRALLSSELLGGAGPAWPGCSAPRGSEVADGLR